MVNYVLHQQIFVLFWLGKSDETSIWATKKKDTTCASLAPARVVACCATLAAASTEAWSWDTKMELDSNPLDISH